MRHADPGQGRALSQQFTLGARSLRCVLSSLLSVGVCVLCADVRADNVTATSFFTPASVVLGQPVRPFPPLFFVPPEFANPLTMSFAPVAANAPLVPVPGTVQQSTSPFLIGSISVLNSAVTPRTEIPTFTVMQQLTLGYQGITTSVQVPLTFRFAQEFDVSATLWPGTAGAAYSVPPPQDYSLGSGATLRVSVQPLRIGSDFNLLPKAASIFAQLTVEGPQVPPNCAEVLKDSIATSVVGKTIQATFRPNGVDVTDAAAICGVNHFNWLNVVLEDPDPNRPSKRVDGTKPQAPYIDPPLGGWDYQPNGDDFEIGYWNSSELPSYITSNSFIFRDAPGVGLGQHVRFRTHLIGITDSGGPKLMDVPAFGWTVNSIGVSVRKNLDESLLASGQIGIDDSVPTTSFSPEYSAFLQANGVTIPEPSADAFLLAATSLLFPRWGKMNCRRCWLSR